MMRKSLLQLLLAVTLAVIFPCSAAFSGPEKDLYAFPEANKGMAKFVIMLPARDRGEEENFKVELIAGKRMMTDGVNRVHLGTAVEPRLLAGWGYTYYEVTGKDFMMSTMMAVPEGRNPVETFVAGTPLLINYNSRLPIVIYAPSDYRIQYRLWRADEKTETASKISASQ